MRSLIAATLLLAVSGLTVAQEASATTPFPVIRDITFEGNNTTQPKVMLREIVIKVGDPADPAKIERSRQAILDLGLFRDVTAEQAPVAGGIRVTFKVREKWYLLPYPRIGANTNREYNYGAEMRWNNIAGLNHSMRLLASVKNTQETGRGNKISYVANYSAPFIFDSPYNLSVDVGHANFPVTTPVAYDEIFNNADVLLTRSYFTGPASQGWQFGGGLKWQSEDTSGVNAPPRWGHATAPVVLAKYRDVRFKVYSEEGTTFNTRIEGAAKGSFSDYSYTQSTADYTYFFPIGDVPYQDIYLYGSLGNHSGGPPRSHAFSLGGADNLRGYERDFVEGNFFYLLSAEYLRPVGWNWLRAAVILEVGSAWEDANHPDGHVYGSVGLGLRIRFTRFVNFELEGGVAYPVSGGSPRIFGGSRRF